MANSTAFIDQNLAAQLFIAARAHDSLRQEPENLLPSAITDIFTIPTSHTHRYRTATYSALAKSQTAAQAQNLQRLSSIVEEPTNATTTTSSIRPEAKIVVIARNEPRILKLITSFLGKNDKQSLMFAVTEMNPTDKEDTTTDTSINLTIKAPGGPTTLAEDIYHRELEELDNIRAQYLTQLAQTRELESRMEDLQQQIDRTKCILNNSDSGDLLLLNYMASRLYLIRELTSRDYDDFFLARAQYSTWCLEQQKYYTQIARNSLGNQKALLDISKTAQDDCYEQAREFLADVTSPSLVTSEAGSNEDIKFIVETKVSFASLVEEGKDIVSISSLGSLHANAGSSTASVSPQKPPQSVPSDPTLLPTPSEQAKISPLSLDDSIAASFTPFKNDLTVSLSQFEQHVCETMERLSQLSLQAIRKKFIDLKSTDDLPQYVTDIHFRIEEKGSLVQSSSEYAEMVKENLIEEFEERIRQSYDWVLEQQVNRLKRIQKIQMM